MSIERKRVVALLTLGLFPSSYWTSDVVGKLCSFVVLALCCFSLCIFICARPPYMIRRLCNFVAVLAWSFALPDLSRSYRVYVLGHVGPPDVIGKHSHPVALLALKSVFLGASSSFSVSSFSVVLFCVSGNQTL